MQKSTFYDPHRQKAIVLQPEERVRQNILHVLVHTLGFPKSCIAVERALSECASACGEVPKRRIDIIAYAQVEQELKPLLVIECKATTLHPNMLDQLLGYNHFIQAPFVALMNQKKTIFGQYDTHTGSLDLSTSLPTYEELLTKINRRS